MRKSVISLTVEGPKKGLSLANIFNGFSETFNTSVSVICCALFDEELFECLR